MPPAVSAERRDTRVDSGVPPWRPRRPRTRLRLSPGPQGRPSPHPDLVGAAQGAPRRVTTPGNILLEARAVGKRGDAKLRLIARFGLLTAVALGLGGCSLPTFGGFRGATTQGQTEFKLWSWMTIAG